MKGLLGVSLLATLLFGAATSEKAQTSVPESEVAAVRELIARAEAGDAKAQYDLGGLLDAGFADLPVDSLQATHYYSLSANQGYAPAQNYLGFRYYLGQGGLPQDVDTGIKLIGQAAAQGDAIAANNLGWLLLQGDPDEAEYVAAAEWFRKAADVGVASAQAQLADLYREGLGVACDTVAAIDLYTRAIEGGLFDAQYKLLAMMYDSFTQLSADEAHDLGLAYYTHRGPMVGVTLFEIAADKGSAEALALLGDAYSRAQGVSYDHEKSLDYFYRAALAGNPSAQFVVAELLDMFPDALDGLGAEYEKIPDAQFWYSEAAKAGVTDAETATRRLLHPQP